MNDLSSSNIFQNNFLNKKDQNQNYFYEQIGKNALIKKNSNLCFIYCLRVFD